MSIFFYLLPIFIFLFYLAFRVSDVKNLCYSIVASQKENAKNMDDRITSMRDLVRTVDKTIYKIHDELSHHWSTHGSDHLLKTQISAIESEIKEINSCLLKLVAVLENSKKTYSPNKDYQEHITSQQSPLKIAQPKTKKVKHD